MAVGKHDVEINGVKYRLDRQAESPYQKSSAALRLTSQASLVGDVLHYREDLLDAHQTDFSGGSQWWQPRLNRENPTGYLTSTLFDAWSEPGKLRPAQQFETDAIPDNEWLTGGAMIFTAGFGWVLIDSTGDMRTYSGAGNWGDLHTPVEDVGADSPWAMAKMENGSGWFYIFREDDALVRIESTGTLEVHCTSGTLAGVGVVGRQGLTLLNYKERLLIWDGRRLIEVDEATADTVTVVGDDGSRTVGTVLASGDGTTATLQRKAMRTAAIGDDGIYVVKTIYTGTGNYQPVVFRFFNDGETDVFEEVCKLPVSTFPLSVFWHLGQLLVLVSANVSSTNAAADALPQTTLYFVQDRKPGVIHQFDPSNSPYLLLGAYQQYAYAASPTSLFLLDPARAAVHKVADIAEIASMGVFEPGQSTAELFFVQGQDAGVADNQVYWQDLKTDPADRVFNSAETASWLSNWIDFDAPNETKVLSRVGLLTDALTAGAIFTVKVRVNTDAASQTTILTASTDGDTFHQAGITDSAITGRRFQLEIEYTGATDPLAIYSISLEASGQEYVKVWDLVLDGQNAVNVENKPVRSADIDDDLDTLVTTAQPITFIDGYRSATPDDNTTHTVRVENVQVSKKSHPDRMTARVRLAEVPA